MRKQKQKVKLAMLVDCQREISVMVERSKTRLIAPTLVEGNYPMDFLTREEQVFQTENEAVKAAELFHQNVTA